ncbi:alpha/beta hydrolase [Pseudooceanicola algae]|uniref:Alpha/beta hydrolase fold-3 domain-containing protein n=1 Tax=Pseudooceanicola algae TaxID=1537215 RepID=A0A418SHQ4_9RHOB|nr:alpha/beta hydrolase [Pseudooceanicola algae]QPM90258.1 hypothetical protein PSAL_014930 [Pseudooceanicola algae]
MIETFKLAPQPPLPVAAANAYAEAALEASRGGWPGVDEKRDIAFGPAPWQSYDLFAPAAPPPGGADVLIFFHGGGWTNGYKEWCGFMAPALAARGVMLAAPSYRLAPETRYPLMLEDALEATAAIIAEVAAHGGNPNRIFVAGHSAGGQLAALTGLRHDLWAAHGIPEGALRGCCPISGILDLHHPDPAPGSLEAMVYDKILSDPRDDRAASPLSWVEGRKTAMFLSWGAQDTDRVCRANLAARDRLDASPLPGRSLTMEADHFGTHLALRDPSHPWYDILDDIRKATL